MLDEIYEQPQAIASAVEQEYANVARLVSELRERDIRHVIIAARGTSDNAATYAKYLLEIVCGVPVSLAAPSVYTLYDAHVQLSGCLMIGISQSGQATDVVQTLSTARATGALTACITNVANSPITYVSDHVLLCHAGEEKAIAATKTYTTALALIALLAGQWGNKSSLLNGLKQIPEQMRAVLELDAEIAQAVERYRYITECAVLARGLNQATALEAALKMIGNQLSGRQLLQRRGLSARPDCYCGRGVPLLSLCAGRTRVPDDAGTRAETAGARGGNGCDCPLPRGAGTGATPLTHAR